MIKLASDGSRCWSSVCLPTGLKTPFWPWGCSLLPILTGAHCRLAIWSCWLSAMLSKSNCCDQWTLNCGSPGKWEAAGEEVTLATPLAGTCWGWLLRAHQGALAEQRQVFAKAAVAFALSSYFQWLSEKPRESQEILLSLRLSDSGIRKGKESRW